MATMSKINNLVRLGRLNRLALSKPQSSERLRIDDLLNLSAVSSARVANDVGLKSNGDCPNSIVVNKSVYLAQPCWFDLFKSDLVARCRTGSRIDDVDADEDEDDEKWDDEEGFDEDDDDLHGEFDGDFDDDDCEDEDDDDSYRTKN